VSYDGLPEALRREVLERDNMRCRWCGRTNARLDLHHIEYRRGTSYDRADNLISLCRQHHGFVHGTKAPSGQSITKSAAQLVLAHLVAHPGTTGLSTWRAMKRRWALDGKCEQHGLPRDACVDCDYERRQAIARHPSVQVRTLTAEEANFKLELVCEECGNDLACEGYRYCSDCLEAGVGADEGELA